MTPDQLRSIADAARAYEAAKSVKLQENVRIHHSEPPWPVYRELRDALDAADVTYHFVVVVDDLAYTLKPGAMAIRSFRVAGVAPTSLFHKFADAKAKGV